MQSNQSLYLKRMNEQKLYNLAEIYNNVQFIVMAFSLKKTRPKFAYILREL